MSRTLKVMGLAALAALALSGCLREDGTYKLQEDNTVDGNIVLAVTQEQLDSFDVDSYKDFGLDADAVAAGYDHATVNDLGQDGWDGDRITLVSEGITSFTTAPDEAYEIKIDRVSDQYIVTGMDPDLLDDSTKNSMINSGGSAILKVTFPGKVLEHNGSKNGRTVTWDMTTEEDAPYARGMAVKPEPVAEPEPEPSPEPEPVATVEESPAAQPSPTATEAPAPITATSSGVPPWVWIAIAVLGVAVAGLVGFMIAGRAKKPAVPAATAPEPSGNAEPAPEAKESAE